MFFKVVTKLGHGKFIEYLVGKYAFVEELLKKMDTNAVVGYPKDSLNVFHSFPLMEHVFVSPGMLV